MSIGYIAHGSHSSISAATNKRMAKSVVGIKPPGGLPGLP